MNRTEFIACSLAFHAALLVLAVLLPAPFPSQKAHTTTDLTYVEVEQAPEQPAPELPSWPEAASIIDLSSLDPDIMGRLAPSVPGGLVLREGTQAIAERIKTAASTGTAGNSAHASDKAFPKAAPEAAAQPVENITRNADTGAEKTVPSQQEDETAPAQDNEDTTSVPELTANAAPDSEVGRVTTHRKSLNFRYQEGWPPPSMLDVDIDTAGDGEGPEWTAKADRDWILVAPARGKGKGKIQVGVLASGRDTGYHEGTVRLKENMPGSGEIELAVSLMVLPKDPGIPELPHFSWDDYMDGACKVCHLPKELMPSADFMMRPEFCSLCHNPAGMASGSIPGRGGHPVMINATSGGARFPTGGTVASGAYSDKMSTHLLGGDGVVCVTCHNVMYKPGDYARTWELASPEEGLSYRLAKGGWAGMGWLVPKVYVTKSLTPFPDRLSGLKSFIVRPTAYEYDEAEGLIRFKEPPGKGSFVYVTLSNPYLRAPTANNTMCYDCHTCNTHQGLNCLVCHTAHGTSNIRAVREEIRIPGGGLERVVFRAYSGENSFSGRGKDPSGVCDACHAMTSIHNPAGRRLVHADGRDYTGSDCTRCHKHGSGFTADAGGSKPGEKPLKNTARASH